jgi:hypothetical protein
MHYSLFFHDHAGHVFSHADISAIDNDDAIDVARRLYRTGIGRGYEIWRTGRHIHTESAYAPS